MVKLTGTFMERESAMGGGARWRGGVEGLVLDLGDEDRLIFCRGSLLS